MTQVAQVDAAALDSPEVDPVTWTELLRTPLLAAASSDAFTARVSVPLRRTTAGVSVVRVRLLDSTRGVFAERTVAADTGSPPIPPQLLTLAAEAAGTPARLTKVFATVELRGQPAALVHNLQNIVVGTPGSTLVAYLTSASNFSYAPFVVFAGVSAGIDGVYVPQAGTGPGSIVFLSTATPPPSPGPFATLPGVVNVTNVLNAVPFSADVLQLTLTTAASVLSIIDGGFVVITGLYEDGVLSGVCNQTLPVDVVSTGSIIRVPYTTPTPTPTFTGGVVSPLGFTLSNEPLQLVVQRFASTFVEVV